MVWVCKICGKKITDGSKIPMYIGITGWDLDEGQYNFEVCRECFVTKGKEMLEILEKNKDNYT